MNLAFALAMHRIPGSERKPKIGILDLDIFGPSVPKLMGLESAEEPRLTKGTFHTASSCSYIVARLVY